MCVYIIYIHEIKVYNIHIYENGKDILFLSFSLTCAHGIITALCLEV